MKKIKFIITAVIAAVICLQSTVFADSGGNPNIDNGGGNLLDGSQGNFWNPGNDGVRVTIVDSETGAIKSESIDYSNTNVSDIVFHFGKKCKTEYVGGASLSVNTGSYICKTPVPPLPVIISDGESLFADIDQIRSYFTDEQVIMGIAGHVGFDYDKLIGGDYKLMIEPIMYITYNGVRTAMTATEAALYNIQTDGDLSRKFAPLSHKNLPLAMFLEDDDLGYRAWTGSTTSQVTDSDIINYLGVGIVSFKEHEEEIEIEGSDYEYRFDTDVYTSITVSGDEHTPDNPITVRFYIKNKCYTVGNVVFPEGSSQLVWVKWHTPNTEQIVNIHVEVEGDASASMTDITAKIPEELFQQIKDYLQRNNMTQKDFVIGLIEAEIERDLTQRQAVSEAPTDSEEMAEEQTEARETAAVSDSESVSEEVGEQLEEQENADYSGDFEAENEEYESIDEEFEEEQDESEDMGLTMGM